jgi:hypothetical protein
MSEDSGFILTVYSDALDGRNEEYERWYTGTHFGEVLEIPGFVGAQLHRIPGNASGAATYLAIYELEGDPGAALAELDTRMKSGAMMPPAGGDVKSLRSQLYQRASARATAQASSV